MDGFFHRATTYYQPINGTWRTVASSVFNFSEKLNNKLTVGVTIFDGESEGKIGSTVLSTEKELILTQFQLRLIQNLVLHLSLLGVE